MIAFVLICCYLLVLLTVALAGRIGYKKNSAVDYFLASRACGSFLLVMTIFGTTMSSFALVGSTNEAYRRGISVYGQMASWSGLIHSACFFLIGTKLWYHGKRFGYSTQIQFFRDRFQSPLLGYLLFPILVGWVVPYVMLNIIGAGTAIETVTKGAFTGAFPATNGGVPQWLGSAAVCVVVLIYVFSGGMRSLSFANGIHATVLVALGGVILFLVVGKLGGPAEATRRVAEIHSAWLTNAGPASSPMTRTEFLTYLFVPLSVGMFPHLFQHWMTAKDVKTFRPVVILHPLFIMLVWAPCILLGVWATSATINGAPLIDAKVTNVLAALVARLTNPVVAGFLAVGIVSATMSLDSQFLALSSMFTHDIIARLFGENRFSDRQRIVAGRTMVVAIVATAYALSRCAPPTIYQLGVWCFSGFAGLFPLVFAALYWRRVTTAGAIASIISTLTAWVWLFRESKWGANKDYLFHGMLPAAAIFAASAATIVVVSLVTRPPAAEVVSRYFSDEEEAAAARADLRRVPA